MPAWMRLAAPKFQKEHTMRNAPIAVMPRPNACARCMFPAIIHPAMKRYIDTMNRIDETPFVNNSMLLLVHCGSGPSKATRKENLCS